MHRGQWHQYSSQLWHKIWVMRPSSFNWPISWKYLSGIYTGCLKMISTKAICNCAVKLNSVKLQTSSFWLWYLQKYWSKIVRSFIGTPKICLFNCFANTYVPPETPNRGTFLFWGYLVCGCPKTERQRMTSYNVVARLQLMAPMDLWQNSNQISLVPKLSISLCNTFMRCT